MLVEIAGCEGIMQNDGGKGVQHVKRLKGAYITYDRRALTFIAHLSKMGGLDGESATSTDAPPT